jgi:hypothetical protein
VRFSSLSLREKSFISYVTISVDGRNVGVNDWADAGGGNDVINCASPASFSLWQPTARINKVDLSLSSPSASVGTERF